MVEADSVMRAARNAFLVLIIVLMAVSVYQFVFVEGAGLLVGALWTLGVVVYYLSKVYYDRQTNEPVSSVESDTESRAESDE